MIMKKLLKAESYIKSFINVKPSAAVILGSGLGSFASSFNSIKEISYSKIPYFPCTGVQGHEGKLVFVNADGKDIVVMSGRPHY